MTLDIAGASSPAPNYNLKDEICDYWSGRAATFDQSVSHWIEPRHGLPEWQRLVRGACALPPGGDLAGWQVLDIACGTGEISQVLTSLGASVTGLDFSETMLGLARRKLAGKDWRYVLSDAEAMVLIEENTFDFAITRHLAWTLTNPQTAYGEWFRVLKPGGRLLVVDGNFRAPKGFYQRLRNWLADRLSAPRPAQGDRARHEAILDRLPYGDGLDAGRLASDLQAAGFDIAGQLPVRPLYGKGMRGHGLADRLRQSSANRFALVAVKPAA
ncbi:class I SAM-dependent methyltransferase [Roseibium sp. Sym1]|uniref:class I SAM-dependent methyltransferase n=1 Tax=Roseibium sp. Sym1 TaxID=3016006 RepID=UPI0022B41C00|nr:class I SAM-dependent methyltransferase [Roseibium sp. Sym1]